MHFDRLDESYAMVNSNLNFGKVTLTGLTGLCILVKPVRPVMPILVINICPLCAKEQSSGPKLSKGDE